MKRHSNLSGAVISGTTSCMISSLFGQGKADVVHCLDIGYVDIEKADTIKTTRTGKKFIAAEVNVEIAKKVLNKIQMELTEEAMGDGPTFSYVVHLYGLKSLADRIINRTPNQNKYVKMNFWNTLKNDILRYVTLNIHTHGIRFACIAHWYDKVNEPVYPYIYDLGQQFDSTIRSVCGTLHTAMKLSESHQFLHADINQDEVTKIHIKMADRFSAICEYLHQLDVSTRTEKDYLYAFHNIDMRINEGADYASRADEYAFELRMNPVGTVQLFRDIWKLYGATVQKMAAAIKVSKYNPPAHPPIVNKKLDLMMTTEYRDVKNGFVLKLELGKLTPAYTSTLKCLPGTEKSIHQKWMINDVVKYAVNTVIEAVNDYVKKHIDTENPFPTVYLTVYTLLEYATKACKMADVHYTGQATVAADIANAINARLTNYYSVMVPDDHFVKLSIRYTR